MPLLLNWLAKDIQSSNKQNWKLFSWSTHVDENNLVNVVSRLVTNS